VIDHLVYGTPDVDGTVEELARRLGVRAAPGGRHPGLGTRNALLSLGSDSYLEIIGPDEAQPRPAGGRWYGLDDLTSPRLVTWAAAVESIERVAAHAHAAGYDPGDVHQMYRERPDEVRLSWRATLPTGAGDGLVPILMEWDDCPHPATTSPTGLSLVALRGFHPVPESIRPMLRALQVELEIVPAVQKRLVAVLDSPMGSVELS
jgi:hypothetical protein